MRLHRFYLKTPISSDKFDVTDRELIHQWRNVFRYNVASQVVLFDGNGHDFLAIITSLRNLGATVEILKKMKKIFKPKINLWLCLSVIKKDNFELAVQKATELGVTNIIPILSDKSEKKNLNMERLIKISVEASEQSGRGAVPKIHPVTDLSSLFQANILPQNKAFLSLKGEYIGDFLQKENLKEVAVFVGAEGGFSEKEEKFFKTSEVTGVSLGEQVLRSETAGIAVSSLLLL